MTMACSPEPHAIRYGEEACQYCSMSIVDQRFGCEIVTNKNKVYKFDAVECMIHYVEEGNLSQEDIALVLTNSFDNPGALQDAKNCYFLYSKSLPSPMGMYINPFTKNEQAMAMQQKHEGKVFSWNELPELLHVNNVSFGNGDR